MSHSPSVNFTLSHSRQTPTQTFSQKTPGTNSDFCSLKLPSNEAHTFEMPHKISAPYSVCWQPCLRQTYWPCLQYGYLWVFTP